ncbi:MAG: acetyltransferase [Bacillales bacterium]|jgi:N-hydroxyarylamine O-acetyltransferase|nr:acetyltransferase [Bacillales bacterium]
MSSEVTKYLERIGYEGTIEVNLNTLSKLQECHLKRVPFENFDIINRKPISLDVEQLYQKIVCNNRGGFCFELNALFGSLLRELGFRVTDYIARFWRYEENLPPMRQHHVLKVKINGKFYICDVGVGVNSPLKPIEMIEGLVQNDGHTSYKLVKDYYFGWILFEKEEDQWHKLYSFTEEPQLPKDFIMPSYWCENSDDSIFKNTVRVAIRTNYGINTILGSDFRVSTSEGIKTFVPKTDEEYNNALKEYFNIVL